MTSLGEFFGRLHLVLLHLPIGFLLLAGALAAFSFWKKTSEHRPALHWAVGLGALSAALTAACGWLLAREGGYDEALLQRHQSLGFATTGLAAATWLLRRSRWYFPALFATVAAVAATGHFGGSLTHGEGYLFQKTENQRIANTLLHRRGAEGEAPTAFAAFIQPIFQKKCVSCHNPQKKKGGLLLDSPEGILKGGKQGPILVAGKPDSSELYRRVILPSHDDDRMPPKGKLPLVPEEIELVRRWIESGANFSQPAVALQASENVGSQVGAFPPVQVEPADLDDLDLLRKNQISVMYLGQDISWLSVSVAGKKNLDAAKMELLKKIKNQVVHLDLSHSNMDDKLLMVLKNLPHLTRLNLSNTAVTGEGLRHLAGLQFLDYLNLTSTNVSDEDTEILGKLPALRLLFVWNSRFTPVGIERVRAQLPNLRIEAGLPADTAAAPLQLRAPKILFARNIFEDTVQVALDFPFKTVSLFYTLDQASPTTQSQRYKGEPLVFEESTTLRAIAAKDGWENSPIAQASFVKRKWKPKSVTLVASPSPKYPGEGAASLADGKIGEAHTDKTFLGYEGEHLTAVLDFGEKIDFRRLSVHYVENNGSWVFAPHGLQVWTSNDGKTWRPCIRARYPVPAGMQENKTSILSETVSKPVQTRYLKVRVESLLKNPKWHAGAGRKCWVFVDELLVE